CAQCPRVKQRREPFAERHRYFAVEHRHQLSVAPHVRLAPLEAVARPRACLVQIVAREQRRAAGTEMVASVWIERRGATRHRTFEVGEKRHKPEVRSSKVRSPGCQTSDFKLQTSYLPRSSESFFFWSSSMCLMWRSVIFWTSSSPFFSSSSEIWWSFRNFLSRSFASRRTWRTLLRASSLSLCT